MDSKEEKLRTTLTDEELIDKIKGIIYGTAIGDGIGLSTEFMHVDQAKILYGNGPIRFGNATKGHGFWRDAVRRGWFDNDFTDDTDQMLLILQSLLDDSGTLNPLNFAFRLKEWCRVGFPELENKLPNGIGFTVGSSTSHEKYLTNPLQASYEIWNKQNRNLAANGALMRTGPLGASYFWDEEKVVQNSMLAAKVTHADPRSVTSSVIACVLISRMLRGDSPEIKRPDRGNLSSMLELGSTSDDSYLELFKNCMPIHPKNLGMPLHRTILKEIRRFAAYMAGVPFNPLFEADFNIPEHIPVNLQRFQHPAELRENILPIDEYGADDKMLQLAKQVVDDYAFLVEGNTLCPEENGWREELYAHSFPGSISALKLNERPKIGYAFKCLGAGLYLGTRKIQERMSPPEFFENLITQLLLETGDADTNCAVAGAILGCRLGKSGLPKDWVEGIRHKNFIEDIADKFCEIVLKNMKAESD